MRILLVTRYPGIDRVPNLRSLIRYLGEQDVEIDIVCPREELGTRPAFTHGSIRVHEISPRNDKLRRIFPVPTIARILWRALRLGIRRRPDLLLGTDKIGITLARWLAAILRLSYVVSTLEYPEKKTDWQTLWDRREYSSLKRAKFIITHDSVHADIISREVGIPIDRFMLLPNGGLGLAQVLASTLLANKFNFGREAVILLHSGGLGPWFDSQELARSAQEWPAGWALVFHTSRRLPAGAYSEEFRKLVNGRSVFLDDTPLPSEELDMLVSSAAIGIAFYSRRRLGFRAENMGQAAGKIGQYLKCGLPVIATDAPSIRAYIDRYGCGICVGSPEEIPVAIRKIMGRYEEFRGKALRCYNEIWAIDRPCAEILKKMESFRRR